MKTQKRSDGLNHDWTILVSMQNVTSADMQFITLEFYVHRWQMWQQNQEHYRYFSLICTKNLHTVFDKYLQYVPLYSTSYGDIVHTYNRAQQFFLTLQHLADSECDFLFVGDHETQNLHQTTTAARY